MLDPLLDVLLKHESWATRLLLEECQALTPEQFPRPLGLGLGNIEQTMTHVIGAMIFFADRLNRIPPRPRPDHDPQPRTPELLLTLFDQADRELRQAIITALETHAMTDILNWTDDDTGEIHPLDQITYALALAQMIDHSLHHRTEALDMLRLLGVDKPMSWHPFEWDEVMRGQDT